MAIAYRTDQRQSHRSVNGNLGSQITACTEKVKMENHTDGTVTKTELLLGIMGTSRPKTSL
jgi:hypothetical protein